MFCTIACEEQIHTRGNIPHLTDISKIKKGIHEKADIENILGTPSAIATFQNETWYYVGGHVKSMSFFKPKFLDRKVLVIKFDKVGKVKSVSAKRPPKKTSFDLVQRETPTKGKKLTFIQQLIGNVGRFSTPKNDSE